MSMTCQASYQNSNEARPHGLALENPILQYSVPLATTVNKAMGSSPAANHSYSVFNIHFVLHIAADSMKHDRGKPMTPQMPRFIAQPGRVGNKPTA